MRGRRNRHVHKGAQHSNPSGSQPSRLRLTESEVAEINIAQRMCSQFKWESARPFQVEGTRAQLLGRNAVIHASTGSGKTAIAAGPHTVPQMHGKVTLFVAPLLTLHAEMTKTFKSKFGLSAIALNSLIEGSTKDIFQDIIAGKYQVVILAPEMLLHRRFVDTVLKSQTFRERILSVVIDEAHCISHWGDNFRKLYGMIGAVRAFLLPRTSIIAMSGTLTRRVRRDICKKLGFSSSGSNYIFIDEGNARLNVSLASIRCKHPLHTYRDLDLVIPPHIHIPNDIPKTFVYCDDKDSIYEIVDHLRSRLPSSINPGVVRPFTASNSPQYREDAMEAFVTGDIRVLVCTEAAGMGCDISDIELVIQWKLAKLLSNLVQRAGRTARDPNRIGIAIQFVEPTAYRLNPTTEAPSKAPSKPRQTKKKAVSVTAGETGVDATEDPKTKRPTDLGFKSDVPAEPELHEDSPGEGILCFAQTTLCRRKVWDSVFGNKKLVPLVPCCDLCDPSFLNRFHFSPPAKQTRAARTQKTEISATVVDALKVWRDKILDQDYPTALWDASAFLSDSLVDSLASMGSITTLEQLEGRLKPKWAHWNKYGHDIFDLISPISACDTRPDQNNTRTRPLEDPTTQANERPVKRARVPIASSSERKLTEHEVMFDDWGIQSSLDELPHSPPSEASMQHTFKVNMVRRV